jgi:hypothetical protein
MGAVFWIRRCILVFAGAFVVIASAQWLKGHALADAAVQGVLWAAVSAKVFTGARIIQSRQGRHCALCRDTPEMRIDRPDGRH